MNTAISPAVVRVPASSANLGPGFDSLGLALNLWLECRFQPAPELAVTTSGCDVDAIPCSAENLIWRTALAAAAHVGQPLPPIQLHIDNHIPLGKGLGSSAAALTAGVIIANQLLGLNWKRARILDEAARLEGHPDNVAACVLGSIVASGIDSGGMTHAIRLPMPASVRVAVVVPDFVLPTHEARAVLPDCYEKARVIFNIQRTALLIAALATGDFKVFPAALEDRLHQPFRESLVPGLSEILKLRAPGLLGCALSGAGPSVLVLYERGAEAVCEHVVALFRLHGRDAQILRTGIAEHGFELRL